MKIKILLLLLFAAVTINLSYAQKIKIYDPAADAEKAIEEAVVKAGNENKQVMIQVGGNWCPWCIKLHNYFNDNDTVKTLLSENYIYVMVNYSKENKNEEVMERLEYPQRFGFPILVILDAKGNRLHTQDTGFLEKNRSYDTSKVERFLKSWTVKAVSGSK